MRQVDIVNFEGYQITDDGRVWSKKTSTFLKPFVNKWGYYIVQLWNNGKNNCIRVHRLVAEAFIPNPDNKPCIDHINTIKTDNRAENLRWCTHKENSNNELTLQHLSDAQKKKMPPRKGAVTSEETKLKISLAQRNSPQKSKQVFQYSLDGELITVWPSIAECGRNGFSQQHICSCCNGKRKTHKKYIWKYN